MNATRAHLNFLGSYIEVWDYYKLLKPPEDTNAHHPVLWMGGQPGKQASRPRSSRYKQCPSIADRTVLYRKDLEHYEWITTGALDPDLIDADGYTSNSKRVQYLQVKIEHDLVDNTYKLPTPPTTIVTTTETRNFSDFEREGGSTALPPNDCGDEDIDDEVQAAEGDSDS
ncbi:unnamed protein product [Phytophthora fragariaefolia]|uniref:Unnamed protein product n=1 Tax=Phytophthora fragariaefolia TaxID=1490495 RepID=A0A9W6U0L9_9STRA|nr:unnamed protein product [Phytophthora fragariaefolia]